MAPSSSTTSSWSSVVGRRKASASNRIASAGGCRAGHEPRNEVDGLLRADAGAARLAGANRMVAALERLKSGANQPLPDQLNAFGISGGVKSGLAALFASHPPLDERIARLKAMGG